jgi:hypothetical protein
MVVGQLILFWGMKQDKNRDRIVLLILTLTKVDQSLKREYISSHD